MAKRLNYEIGFVTDTQQLKADMQKVQALLHDIGTYNISQVRSGLGITKEIQEAALAASDLKIKLQSATNVKTGKLDLAAFRESLQQSGMTLAQYANKLNTIGPTGQKAFLSVAAAIAKSELPMKRVNGLMNELWVTMKNTVRWQITSSALHGFVSGLSQSLTYAKDLNKSLNNIRIVSGQSAEDMARFAKEANAAAKELNATTTAYTDAALIFFQQGLPEDQVRERTDATIKMSNVTGDAVDLVSSQMTAIWNNFDDGSKSLEYFADVMTALGASTASSTSEIAEGLEKFASITNTVGLSYEYATAALATVVDTTRQSADTVGTAFKTIFARIQGLQLGETLDDGTNLNKYSKALDSVGISIKDASGDLKDMDSILNELGGKWQGLAQDQKMALAQTVAGVRQYTQLIALLDNWDKFQVNLGVAQGAEGELSKQADVYAESWEAASKRVKASAQGIFDSILEDDVFIGLNNVLADILTGIEDIIDGAGGLGGVLESLGFIITKVFQKQMAEGLRNSYYNLTLMSGKVNEANEQLKRQAALLAQSYGSKRNASEVDALARQTAMQIELNNAASKLTEEQKRQLNGYIDMTKILDDLAAKTKNEANEFSKLVNKAMNELLQMQGLTQKSFHFDAFGRGAGGQFKKDLNAFGIDSSQLTKNYTSVQEMLKVYTQLGKQAGKIDNIRKSLETLSKDTTQATMGMEGYNKELQRVQEQVNALKLLGADGKILDVSKPVEALQQLEMMLQKIGSSGETDGYINKIAGHIEYLGRAAGLTEDQMNNLRNSLDVLRDSSVAASERLHQSSQFLELAGRRYSQFNQEVQTAINRNNDFANKIVALSNHLFSLSMAITSIQNLGSIWNNEDLTTSEKLIQSLSAVAMILPVVATLYKGLNATLAQTTIITGGNTDATNMNAAAKVANAIATRVLRGATISLNTAMALSMGIFGAIGVAIFAIVKHFDALKKAEEAARQATLDSAESAKEENEAHKSLIDTMQQALKTYQENGENKDELDNATQALAEAYHIEGAALSNLTGEYSDYNSVLKEAIALEREEREQRLEKVEAARNEMKLEDEGLNSDFVSIKYGYGDESHEQNILKDTFGDEFQTTAYSSRFDINAESSQEIIEIYDNLIVAKQRMERELSSTDLANSGTYKNLTEYIEKHKEAYEQFRQLNDEANLIRTSLNNESVNVQSFADYVSWVDEVKKEFDSLGYSEEHVQELFNQLVESSSNPDLSGYKEIADAMEDIQQKSSISYQTVKNAFLSDEYDNAVLASMHWASVTDANFEEAYESAEKYKNALDSVADATENITSIESAISHLGAGEELSRDTLNDLAGDIDWGNEEQNIIEFTQFLQMTATEQKNYLQNMLTESSQALVDGLNQTIEESERIIAERQSWLDQNKEDIVQAHDMVDLWNQIKEAYTQYHSALMEGNSEEMADASESLQEILEGTGINLADIIYLNEDDFEKKFEEETKNANVTIQGEIDAEGAIKDAQKKLDSSKNELTINIKANVDNQTDRIRNSVKDLVTVFDAIEEGARKSTNAAGESVWSFSTEAAEAISSIYPGFAANADVLLDGTLQLTDAMYQAFFDSSKGQLAVDVDTKTAMLDNIYAKLEQEKTSMEASMEIARGLASGQITLASLEAEQKEQLLNSYATAEQTVNGKLLESQVDELTKQDENYSDLWRAASDYSAQGVTNMSRNVAGGTQNLIQHFKQIIKAAASAGKQVAKIGTEDFSEEQINYSAPGIWTGGSTNIDTSNWGNFIDSIEDIVLPDNDLGQGIGALQKDFYSKSQEVGKYLLAQQMPAYNAILKQMDAVNLAKSELQRNLDEAYDSLREKDKAGKKKGGSDNKGTIEELEEIAERYHEITREIEYQEHTLKELQNQIDRTYGFKKIELYRQELEKLNKIADLQKKKALMATADIDIDAEKLKKLKLSPNVLQDGSFDLDNYTAMLQQAADEYNTFMEKYNSLGKKEQEKLADQKEEAQKLFEDRKAALEQYEKTINIQREQMEKYWDTMRQKEDSKLNAVNQRLEVVLDLKEAKDEVRDFTREIIESFGDEITHGKEKLENMFEGALANVDIYSEFEQSQNELIDLLNNANQFTDTEAINDSLDELRGEIIATGEALLDWIDNLENEFPDALDDARERFEVFTSVLEHNQSTMDTIKELMTLQGMLIKTEKGFTDMQRIASSSLKASLGQAQLEKLRYDRASEELLQAEATLRLYNEGDAAYDGAYKKWKALLEETQQAEEAYLQSAQAAMEKAKEIYTNAIEKAAYDFEQILSRNQGFDLLQMKFDNFIDEEERYLDEVNKIYETTKLNNKIQESIDKSTSQAATAQLKALQEEFKQREENNKLSKYDIEIMEAKYNMILKQIALEEAQNAKYQVRLKRNAQGNMSYQFTSNADEVADANDEYLDSANEWYNIAKNQVKDTSSEIVQAWQDMNEKIKEIYEDESLTVEERENQIAEIRRHYSQVLQDLESEKQKAIKDMTEAGEIVIDDFENNYADQMDNMSLAVEDFNSRFDECINAMNDAFAAYGDATQEIGDLTGTTYDELSEKIDQTNNSTQEFADAGLEATDMMWDQLAVLQDSIDYYLSYAAAIMEAVRALQQLAMQNVQAKENAAQAGGGIGEFDMNKDYMKEALLAEISGEHQDAVGYIGYRGQKIEKMYGEYTDKQAALDTNKLAAVGQMSPQDQAELQKMLEGAFHQDAINDFIRKHSPVSFSTGGYTGNYTDDSSAKIAFLHQKELILNEDDTSNILNAVSGIRALEPILLKQLESLVDKTSMNGSLGQNAFGAIDLINMPNKDFMQNVEIHAEFPAATDQNEIREALTSLANRAVQFINKR